MDNFWPHLNQKSSYDRPRRLRLLPCALELIAHSRFTPQVIRKYNETLYRFSGQTPGGIHFYVQVKEDMKRDQKFFMSVFPAK